MRLSDAGLRRRQTKVLYPNHRFPPWLTEAATTRDRSNRLLAVTTRLPTEPANAADRERTVPQHNLKKEHD